MDGYFSSRGLVRTSHRVELGISVWYRDQEEFPLSRAATVLYRLDVCEAHAILPCQYRSVRSPPGRLDVGAYLNSGG